MDENVTDRSSDSEGASEVEERAESLRREHSHHLEAAARELLQGQAALLHGPRLFRRYRLIRYWNGAVLQREERRPGTNWHLVGLTRLSRNQLRDTSALVMYLTFDAARTGEVLLPRKRLS
jgi:hypothetical protein